MLRKKLLKSIFVSILILVVFNITTIDSITAYRQNSDSSFSINIINANYTDLDNDNVEDDITAWFTINLKNNSDLYNIILSVSLILPSGTNHHFYYFIETDGINISCILHLYNYATESGWYTIKIDGFLLFEEQSCWISTSLTFDPPGGSPGEDPLSTNLTIMDENPPGGSPGEDPPGDESLNEELTLLAELTIIDNNPLYSGT